jgi:ABC-type uncharacterized transport system permease subunit
VLLTMFFGAIIFSAIGYDGIGAVRENLPYPAHQFAQMAGPGGQGFAADYHRGGGLSIAYRANVWNIGAEGQYIMGGAGGDLGGAADPWDERVLDIAGHDARGFCRRGGLCVHSGFLQDAAQRQ